MLITFTCEAYADITMFGDVASQLLHMMGHSGTVPGAILATDVPQALLKLRSELASLQAEAVLESQSEDEDNPPVSLSQRAMPLIELLEAAIAEQKDMMWKQG